MKQDGAGFTLFEMVIVLVMLGILSAGLAPVLLSQHSNSQTKAERDALNQAKESLIAYAITNGGLPAPWTTTNPSGANKLNLATDSMVPGIPAAGEASFLPSDLALSAPASDGMGKPQLGGANFGVFRKYFWYDARDQLQLDRVNGAPYLGNNSRESFCANVKTALKSPAATPLQCRLPALGEEGQSCPGANAQASGVAFVLLSFGNDRQPSMGHRNLQPSLSAGRLYENPARPMFREHLPGSGDPFYDDTVVSVSLAELASACDKAIGQQLCPGTQKLLTLINGTAGNLYYKVGGSGASCTTLGTGSGQQLGLGCVDPATSLVLFDNDSDCLSPFAATPAPNGAFVSALGGDANGDGQLTIVLPGYNAVRVF